jgi:hypothetical protein
MNRDEFTANHLSNFNPEQLEMMFDWDAVQELPNGAAERQSVLWLSQFLVGNVSEPFNDIAKLDTTERRKVFLSWMGLVQDIDTLKPIFKSIVLDFVD